jgi:uncharacterized protein (DUF1778 family)
MRDRNTTRTENILTRCTLEEKELIQKKANSCGLSVSDYIRLVAIKTEISIKINE